MPTHRNVYSDMYTHTVICVEFFGKKELEKKRSSDRYFGSVTIEVLAEVEGPSYVLSSQQKSCAVINQGVVGV